VVRHLRCSEAFTVRLRRIAGGVPPQQVERGQDIVVFVLERKLLGRLYVRAEGVGIFPEEVANPAAASQRR
jgi:hypothetical protein